MANLVFHYGAMNSGKSTQLIQMEYSLRSGSAKPQELIVIKPGTDTKGNNAIVSRPIGEEGNLDVDILITPETDEAPEMDVYQSIQDYKDINEIGRIAFLLSDESQFFSPDQVDGLLKIAKEDNTEVHAFGIKTDYLKRTFPGSRRLFEVADTLEKLRAWCRCGNEAEFNCRWDNGVPIFDEAAGQIAIEDDVQTHYESLCYGCYEDELTKATKAIAEEIARERALSA